MRYLIICIFFPLAVFSQEDTVHLAYTPTVDTLSFSQRAQILTAIGSARVLDVNIIGYVGSKHSISENRIVLEQRLFSLEQFLLEQRIPSNKITIQRINTSDENLYDKVLLTFEYASPKQGRVFFKTDVAEIADFEAIKLRANDTIEITESDKLAIDADAEVQNPPPVKTYGKLRIEDFKAGQKVVIPELYFVATRHVLRPVSYRSLNDLLEILRDKPTLVIELQGHICCKKNGDDGMDFDTYKPNLSEARAQAIYYYLIQKGISPQRLSYRGFGSQHKLVEDDGDAMKGLVNRRVEVFVISE